MRVVLDHRGGEWPVVDGFLPNGAMCPNADCDAKPVQLARVHGDAGAVACATCRKAIGRIVTSTIFGAEEDAAMLEHGRARVYR